MQGARAGFDQALEVKADDTTALNNLASLLMEYGDGEKGEAEVLLRRALAFDPNATHVLSNLAFLLSSTDYKGRNYGDAASPQYKNVHNRSNEQNRTIEQNRTKQ